MKKLGLFVMPLMAVSLLASCGESKPSITYHVVSFDSNGGSFVEAKQVEDGKVIEPPTNPTRPQYTFDGWELDGTEYTFTEPVKNDIVLKASWTDGPTPIITHNVTFHFNNDSGSGEQTEVLKVAEGDDIVRPTWEPTFAGYEFINWYQEAEGGSVYTFPGKMGTKDVNIYAHWRATQINCTISYSGINCKAYRAGVSPTSATYSTQFSWRADLTDEYKIVLVPDTDYHLPDSISVLFNGQPGTLGTDYEYSKDNKTIAIKKKTNALINLTAIPDTPIGTTYTITFNGTDPLVKIENIEEGSLITEDIPSVPDKEGFTPLGWCTDEEGTKVFDFSKVQIYQDYDLYPGYTPIPVPDTFTITFKNGDTQVGQITDIEAGSLVTEGIPEDPTKEDYTFIGWCTDVEGKKVFDFAKIAIYQDYTLYAGWEKIDPPVSEYAVQMLVIVNDGETISFECDKSDSFTVDWGDGTAIDSKKSHRYSTASFYTVRITGLLHSFKYTGANNQSLKYVFLQNVVSLGSSAFANCTMLTDMRIIKNLVDIGEKAFEGCTNLNFITLPDSVKTIGKSAYHNCSSLVSITIPNSVTSIGDSAFESCLTLNSITIPSSVTKINKSVFSGCIKLASVVIPHSITSFGEEAFKECSSLESFTIPESVTSIGANAFNGCSKLNSITIPNGVTSIGSFAFRGCSMLTSINIPASVTSMGEGVFAYCSGITSMTVDNDNQVFTSRDGAAIINNDSKMLIAGCQDVTVDSLSIGAYAFAGCNNLKNIAYNYVFKENDTIGDSAFRDCRELISFTLPKYYIATIGDFAFKGCVKLASDLTFCPELVSIGDSAFAGCSSLKKVNFEKCNTSFSIGNSAFAGCHNLETVNVSSKDVPMKVVGASAFSKCTSLTSLTIPRGVTSIGANAFDGCSSLVSITLPSLFGQPLSYYFNANIPTSLKTVELTNCTVIDEYAFQDCSYLTSIVIPSGVKKIGDSAFDNCTSLTSIVIPNTVTLIENEAFDNCSNLTTVTFANDSTLETIGGAAFAECCNLTSITIPNSVTSIGDLAFGSCESLTSIVIPNEVTEIGELAFSNCINLAAVDLTRFTNINNLPKLGEDAFYECPKTIKLRVYSQEIKNKFIEMDNWSKYASNFEAPV